MSDRLRTEAARTNVAGTDGLNDGRGYPAHRDLIPPGERRHGRYLLRFAETEGDLDRVLRLRYEVFNLELGEGHETSHETGRDRDHYDGHCHHLMVLDRRRDLLAGTYRMMTSEIAKSGAGLYTSELFELDAIPRDVMNASIELSRACIARNYRNQHVLFLLWRGLARYLRHNDKRYLLGCCSLTSQDSEVALACWRHLSATGCVHPTISVLPRPQFACLDRTACEGEGDGGAPAEFDLPGLFRAYMRHGAKICGAPAIDRAFKTIDFPVLLDSLALTPAMTRLFFENR